MAYVFNLLSRLNFLTSVAFKDLQNWDRLTNEGRLFLNWNIREKEKVLQELKTFGAYFDFANSVSYLHFRALRFWECFDNLDKAERLEVYELEKQQAELITVALLNYGQKEEKQEA